MGQGRTSDSSSDTLKTEPSVKIRTRTSGCSGVCRFLASTLILPVLVILTGCSLFTFDWLKSEKAEQLPLPEVEPCGQELDDKRREIFNVLKDGKAGEEVLHILQSTDPECDNREALYLYALRLGRHNMELLLNMAYALYRGTIFSFRDEYGTWKHDVQEKDMVDRLLYGVWRQERLYHYERITSAEYTMAVRKVTDFFSWFVDNVLPHARELHQAGIDPTDIEVPELRLLSHSFPTFMSYFGRYADHEILGNLRNMEAMRTRFMERVMTQADECGAIPSLRMSGLKILELDANFILQSTVDVSEGISGKPTSAYAFIRNPKDGEMLDRVLVVVPLDRNEPFRQWSGSNSYLLKPVRVPAGFSRVLEVTFREREQREEDPTQKVFRLLGKLKDEPEPLNARIRFVEPEVYRMVSYVETPFLRDLFETCGPLTGSMMNIPGRIRP